MTCMILNVYFAKAFFDWSYNPCTHPLIKCVSPGYVWNIVNNFLSLQAGSFATTPVWYPDGCVQTAFKQLGYNLYHQSLLFPTTKHNHKRFIHCFVDDSFCFPYYCCVFNKWLQCIKLSSKGKYFLLYLS